LDLIRTKRGSDVQEKGDVVHFKGIDICLEMNIQSIRSGIMDKMVEE